MFNKITIPILLVAVIVFLLLIYVDAANGQRIVDAVGGFIVGMIVTIAGTWISKLFKKKKKTLSEEEKNS